MKLFSALIGLTLLFLSCDSQSGSEGLQAGNTISAFEVNSAGLQLNTEVTESLIKILIPYKHDTDNVVLNVKISKGATISPDPATVRMLTNQMQFTITAENGVPKVYTVLLLKKTSPDNAIVSFKIIDTSFETNATVDHDNGQVSQKVPPTLSLSNITTEVEISENASISPDPATIKDYSVPVAYTVTSDLGEERFYVVTLEPMNNPLYINCSDTNASKWFGGDARGDKIDPDFYFEPRNVGTGQSLIPENDLYPESFSVHFSRSFEIADGSEQLYYGDVTLRLHLRNEDGRILASVDQLISSPFSILWVEFDLSPLNIILKKNATYYFTWYLVDGEALGIVTGSTGYNEQLTGPCNGKGLSGTSRVSNGNTLEQWESWGEHSWHFNFRLTGME